MKSLFTNPAYLYINLAIGGAVGFFNCFATQLQQVDIKLILLYVAVL